MNQLLNILCKGLSIVLYPMLVPTYGMALFCAALSRSIYPLPAGYGVIVCTATLVFTCLIPLGMILMLKKRGVIDSIYLTERSQRTRPYLYSIAGFAVWCFFAGYTLHAPLYLLWTAIGSTAAIAIVAAVNIYWKISAHLCAMGGLTGGILSFGMATGTWPTVTLGATLLTNLLLMFARIRLGAHSPEQTVAGYITGLACTTVPNLIIYA